VYSQTRAGRPESVIGHTPLLQTRSRPPDLGDYGSIKEYGESVGSMGRLLGRWDDSKLSSFPTAMCPVAMKVPGEGYIAKQSNRCCWSKDHKNITQILGEVPLQIKNQLPTISNRKSWEEAPTNQM